MLILEKNTIKTEDRCGAVLKEFVIYHDHICSLNFDETPTYTYLRKIFSNIFVREVFEHDHMVDWIILKLLGYIMKESLQEVEALPNRAELDRFRVEEEK